jgi:hypothetical protein
MKKYIGSVVMMSRRWIGTTGGRHAALRHKRRSIHYARRRREREGSAERQEEQQRHRAPRRGCNLDLDH